jgi:flagellar protein FlbD
MIVLTRLSGKEFALNSDLIERVESTPDTVVTLVDGTKYVVAESVDVVVQDVRLHRAEVAALSRYLLVEPVVDDAPADPSRPRLVVVAPDGRGAGR